jgi:glycerophosphoryl diester phosphodiesterase
MPISVSQVIAHRGASAAAPENTLAAFRLAWAHGVDGVECDIRLSADQQIICLHDADTARVGDQQLVAADTAYAELAQVCLPGGGAAACARIPLLQTVLEQKPANTQLLIEVKTGAAIVPQLIELLKQVGTDLTTLVVIAFDAQVVAAVKLQCPELRAYCLLYRQHPYMRAEHFDFKRLDAYLSACGADGIGCEFGTALDAPRVQALHALGYAVNVWTVDCPQDAVKLAHIGVDSVTSNQAQLCYQALQDVGRLNGWDSARE